MFMRRRITFFFCVLWAFLFVLMFWPYKVLHSDFSSDIRMPLKLSGPLLIWWKPMVGLDDDYTSTRYCGVNKCTFTNRRDQLLDAKALLFYGSEFDVIDMPLPRLPQHFWGLLHEESPRNVPYMSHDKFLRHFNFTSTLSRFSDFPLPTLYLHDSRDLTSPAYLVPVGEKTTLQHQQNLAPIVFIQSDCDTLSERDAYVEQLMRYIKVDSYGACLHNRDLPQNLRDDYLNKLYSPELYRFLGRYKFILSYENGVCHDYITEKFWRPLTVGSIPIYFGSPTIKDWLPNSKSIIHISDFPSPKALAEYVNFINSNDSEYNTFLQHKYNQLQPITNKRLQMELLQRDYAPSADPNIMGLFECFVCRRLHEMTVDQTQVATIDHYNCPYPPPYPPMGDDSDHSATYKTWKSIMGMGKCLAEIIDGLLQRNEAFSKEHYEDLQMQKIQTGPCD